jgi:hypothetical protein
MKACPKIRKKPLKKHLVVLYLCVTWGQSVLGE